MGRKSVLVLAIMLTLALFVGLAACGQTTTAPVEEKEATQTEDSKTPEAEPQEEEKEATEAKGELEDPKPAADFEQDFPKQYESYMANSDEAYDYTGAPAENQRNYLEDYPAIKTLYAPSGFAVEYHMPRGHTYALDDMTNIARPKPSSACIACKSAQYVVNEQRMGDEWTAMPFDEAIQQVDQTIGCFDCHENTPGPIKVNRSNFVDAMEEYNLDVPDNTLACAQCHNDYFFEKDTFAIKNPWKYGTDPDSVLKHYNEINYVDFENETSGVPIIKVQHPEFETYTGSIHEKAGLTCVSCHMAPEDGYTSHQWTSPFRSETTMNDVCMTCHSSESIESLEQRVEDIQVKTQDRMRTMSEDYETIHKRIGAAKDTMDPAVKEEVYQLVRDGQFYWDFIFVENSDGFHNSSLSKQTLDKAQQKLDEANAALDAAGVAQ